MSYQQCHEAVLRVLQQQLTKIFQFDGIRTKDLHDVKLAFGLLLKASAADGSIPHLDVSKQVGYVHIACFTVCSFLTCTTGAWNLFG